MDVIQIKKVMNKKLPSVLVSVVYTDYKHYCDWLHPIIYDRLSYPNKKLMLVTKDNLPELANMPTGEQVAALGRDFGIRYARANNFDYILQLDCDVEPPDDIIEQLLAINHPLAGGAVAARGNENEYIGHDYAENDKLERVAIFKDQAIGIREVGATASACLLIAKEVFSKVDYTGYEGPNTIHGRFTADDEYYQIKIFEKLKIRPLVDFTICPWHYDSNGWKYKLWGEKKYWDVQRG